MGSNPSFGGFCASPAHRRTHRFRPTCTPFHSHQQRLTVWKSSTEPGSPLPTTLHTKALARHPLRHLHRAESGQQAIKLSRPRDAARRRETASCARREPKFASEAHHIGCSISGDLHQRVGQLTTKTARDRQAVKARVYPDSEHSSAWRPCLLSANSGHLAAASQTSSVRN